MEDKMLEKEDKDERGKGCKRDTAKGQRDVRWTGERIFEVLRQRLEHPFVWIIFSRLYFWS